MRIGVLGGTFDPIHIGHLAAAGAAMDCANLDVVLLVPSSTPPHRGAAVADPGSRLEMTRLATDGMKGFETSDLEIRRGGASYTVDTLLALRKIYPEDELFLILGWDAARLFSGWRRPDEIRRLASFVVVSRPEYPTPGRHELEEAGLDPERVVLCIRQTPDISASALRQAIAGGESVAHMVPPAVEAYIAQHRLYGDNRVVGR